MNNYVLKYSLTSGKPVNVVYEAKDGSLSQRLVTVRRMNDKSVLVWCHYRKAVRSFQIVNILAAQKQKEHAYV